MSTIVLSVMPGIVVGSESNIDNHLFKGMFSNVEDMKKNITFDLESIVDEVLITHKHDQTFYLFT